MQDKTLVKGAQEVAKQTKLAVKHFNLPDTESVITCYNSGLLGKLYVTQNYVGYKSGKKIVTL